MKKVLFMHTGSGNHGCEAIIRTTSKILDGPKDMILWSGTKSEDIKYGSAQCYEDVVVAEQIKRFSPDYFSALIKRKLLKDSNANMDIFLKRLFKNNVAIAVGGDNYCYPWSAKQAVELDKKIRKHAKYSVLWGCSIDEEAITPEVAEDLAGFDLITAREPVTYNVLKKINPNTVKVADPAFLLDRVDLPLPEGFIEKNTVGINVSPLIMDYCEGENIILNNYEKMIEHIIEDTDMNICLIPHVVWEYNNDRTPINYLFEKYKDTGRVCKIEDGNATEIKGYIARCRFFVGARTHATIAAYSQIVPTLVVGYSCKSIGIAQDLFGTDKDYVCSVQSLKTDDDLANAFKWLVKNETNIITQLQAIIPEYKEQAMLAKKYFEDICK